MRTRQALPALALPVLWLIGGCTTGASGNSAPSATGPSAAPTTTTTTTAAAASASAAGSSPTASATVPPATRATSAAAVKGQQSAVPAEKNPPGDIPDNLAFVPYANTIGRYAFDHPEGWSQTTRGGQVTYTDKLNGVQVLPGTDPAPVSVAQARSRDAAALARSQAAFELRSVTSVTEPGGTGVRLVYRRNSAPDPVTGKQYRDEVERYELVSHGHEVVMELFGPVGADNVDAYRTMVQSLRLS